MLSREHIHTLIQLRHCKGNFFSKLPGELIEEIIDVEPVSNSDIAKALHHAAFARQEDVDALLEMLEANPRLLLEAGNVITPGGDELRRVTIYECLLGAGDYALAEMVQGYFSEIKGMEFEFMILGLVAETILIIFLALPGHKKDNRFGKKISK